MKKKPSSTGMRRDDCQYLHLQCQLETQTGGFQPEVPLLCRLERSTPEGSVTYVLDKSRLSIRLVPPYSEERLAATREYAKEHGFQVIQTEEKIA